MIYEIIILFLLLLAINFIYLFWVYYKKTKELTENFNILYSYIIFTYKKMQEIDKQELFKNDDYTGVIFNNLKELIYKFKDIFNIDEDNDGKKA